LVKNLTKEEQEQNEAYMENYTKLVKRLYWLSRFNVRQFMGNREEGDPRVDYLAGGEGFKNLASAEISGVVRILTMMLGKRKQEFLKVMEEELTSQLKSMEEEIGVVSWADDGTPRFDLKVLREKTAGWPQ